MPEIPFDLHTHTLFSPDGENSAEEMVLRAIELGVGYYAITDHVEMNLFYDDEFNYEKAVKEAAELIPKLKEKYADKIELIFGMELGQPLQAPGFSEKFLKEHTYDFIICSCHNVRDHEDFYFMDYTKNDPYELLDMYFNELLEDARTVDFDVMGHITYPLRYIEGEHGIKIDMERYNGIIDDIFRTLILNGRGIEINTSGLRQKIGRLLPDLGYVKRYRELGGEILTIGSDAHRTADLGKNITEGIETARQAGFTKIAYFKERRPYFINI